jgi:hypothetical protein
MRLFRLLAALAAIPLLAVPAGGTFTLKIFQGHNFSTGQVGESGTATADLNFTYQTRRLGIISYLGAEKIKYFGKDASAVSASGIEKWEDYEAGPAPGYYLIRARSDKHLYLVHMTEFLNQGKAASQWVATFEWEPFPGL